MQTLEPQTEFSLVATPTLSGLGQSTSPLQNLAQMLDFAAVVD